MEEGKFDSNEMKDNIDPSPSTVEKVKLPEIGMIFSSEEEVRTFYNSYATNAGFVEARGYENLSFDERKCRNYISEARRLRLGEGDAEALSNYFCRMQNSATFTWLFNSWLTCMHGCAPKAIIIDQCRAMTIAIEEQFVEQYDSALKKNIENEKKLDFVSFNSIMPVILGHSIERQFQNAYTNNIFTLFQDEIRGLMFCDASLLREEGETLIFEVVENMLGNNGHPGREVSFRVHYTELDCQLKCVCRLFEFRGILCRHVIKVLMRMKVIEVLMRYIMDRWRKDIKRGYQSISNIYDDYGCDGKRLRYNTLTPLMQEVQQLGAENDDICSVLVKIMKDTKEKLIIALENGQSMVEQLEEASTSGAKVIHSPLKVRTKGRPPIKRKQSKVEQIVKKSIAKAQKKIFDFVNQEPSKPSCTVSVLSSLMLFLEYRFVIHYIRSASLRICSGHAGCDGQYTSLAEEEQLLLQRRGRRGCSALEEVRAGEGEEKTAGEGAVAASARGKKGQNLFEGVGVGEGAVAASARGKKGLRRFRRSWGWGGCRCCFSEEGEGAAAISKKLGLEREKRKRQGRAC
ncbi:hypothetical protein ZIOFF_068948 [Zingiber officinale]|uniref:Protein FAR1-RELATED SEQUENCE n=1 Tax=Zingiber officinale TaxID=94328 RepID=A0A8J5CVI6_ZINOF|nr:hypothetical protein ZIOFF_068948 [Zingiber officinale]